MRTQCGQRNWFLIKSISRKRNFTLYLSFSQWTWRNTWTEQFPGMNWMDPLCTFLENLTYFRDTSIWITFFLCRQGHMDATLIKSYTYQLFQVTNPLMMSDLLLILIEQRRLLCCHAWTVNTDQWSLWQSGFVNRGCSSATSDEWCTETWSRQTFSLTKMGWITCWFWHSC